MDRILHLTRHTLPAALSAAFFITTPSLGETNDHVARSVEGFARSVEERGAATLQQLKEQRTAAVDIVTKPRSSAALGATLGEQWFYDADAVLYDDLDDDGYFRYLSVRFDVDTYLASVYVYAMLYLSRDGEVWEHYHTTEDFLIGGTVPDDEYFVETELLEGYPPGLYDVLIEVYDADFGTFSDEFGPNDTSALGLLPLEDASYDVPPIAVSITTESGGGGAIGWLLPCLALAGRRLGRSRAVPERDALRKPPTSALS